MNRSRRSFLKLVSLAVGSLAALPLLAFAKAKKLALPLAKVKALETVGGSTILKLKGKQILFMRVSDKDVHAVSSVCTHKECQVKYNSKDNRIDCGCHGSRFTTSGKVLNGPASKDLQNFNAQLSKDRIIIEIE